MVFQVHLERDPHLAWGLFLEQDTHAVYQRPPPESALGIWNDANPSGAIGPGDVLISVPRDLLRLAATEYLTQQVAERAQRVRLWLASSY